MMKFSILIAFFAVSSSAKIFSSDESVQQYMWKAFKADWGKSYSNEAEDSKRFEIFLENLLLIDERNAAEAKAGGSAIHGITRFSDLSLLEFKKKYLGSNPKLRIKDREVVTISKPPSAELDLVDWTGIYTTPVKDQGYCGSCWAFSATEQVESDTMRTLGTTYILSPEQITQCDRTAEGCNGGWTEHAYNYLTRTGGIETDADYPYTSYFGVTGTCSSDSTKFVVTPTGYTTISGESSMAAYVQSTGPLSVCVDASNWSSYTSGILKVCGNSVDHCVQAVGVDVSGGYWKVRNSWGTSWGESGYIQLAYGSDTCAIASDPTYTAVKLV